MDAIHLMALLINLSNGMILVVIRVMVQTVSRVGSPTNLLSSDRLFALIAASVGNRTGTTGGYAMFWRFGTCGRFREFISYPGAGARMVSGASPLRICCRGRRLLFATRG